MFPAKLRSRSPPRPSAATSMTTSHHSNSGLHAPSRSTSSIRLGGGPAYVPSASGYEPQASATHYAEREQSVMKAAMGITSPQAKAQQDVYYAPMRSNASLTQPVTNSMMASRLGSSPYQQPLPTIAGGGAHPGVTPGDRRHQTISPPRSRGVLPPPSAAMPYPPQSLLPVPEATEAAEMVAANAIKRRELEHKVLVVEQRVTDALMNPPPPQGVVLAPEAVVRDSRPQSSALSPSRGNRGQRLAVSEHNATGDSVNLHKLRRDLADLEALDSVYANRDRAISPPMRVAAPLSPAEIEIHLKVRAKERGAVQGMEEGERRLIYEQEEQGLDALYRHAEILFHLVAKEDHLLKIRLQEAEEKLNRHRRRWEHGERHRTIVVGEINHDIENSYDEREHSRMRSASPGRDRSMMSSHSEHHQAPQPMPSFSNTNNRSMNQQSSVSGLSPIQQHPNHSARPLAPGAQVNQSLDEMAHMSADASLRSMVGGTSAGPSGPPGGGGSMNHSRNAGGAGGSSHHHHYNNTTTTTTTTTRNQHHDQDQQYQDESQGGYARSRSPYSSQVSGNRSVAFNMTSEQENAVRQTEEQIRMSLAASERRKKKEELMNETLSRPVYN